MAVTQEPILSRLDRVDNMLRQLEEIRGSNRSPKSSASYASTPSSEGHASSFDISPRPLEKNCLPISRVMMDTEIKGSLVQRIDQVELRLVKLCMQLEGELENEKKREESSGKKKGFKGLVNKMVKGRNSHSFRDSS
ncbi:hypothetical protein M5689_001254 [Euphorbia peplus]|nr:hypothetical protein M5689_001254 [Euphorbia peplus]